MFVVSRQLQTWLRGESVMLYYTKMFVDRKLVVEKEKQNKVSRFTEAK
jgi:hypothetical protein